MSQTNFLTGSQIVAAATQALTDGGYSLVPTPESWPGVTRLFEDEYGIVAVHVYDTWTSLIGDWPIAQGLLVDLLSEHLTRSEPKAWEGYLVLLTPSPITGTDQPEIAELRNNINRVRKLIATGDELQTLDDVHAALLPLLPLDLQGPSLDSRGGLLDRLPELLRDYEISNDATETVVDAFLHNASIVDRLHQRRTSQ